MAILHTCIDIECMSMSKSVLLVFMVLCYTVESWSKNDKIYIKFYYTEIQILDHTFTPACIIEIIQQANISPPPALSLSLSLSLSPMHVKEDITSTLSSLSDIFLSGVNYLRVVVGLPGMITDGVNITNVVSWAVHQHTREKKLQSMLHSIS